MNNQFTLPARLASAMGQGLVLPIIDDRLITGTESSGLTPPALAALARVLAAFPIQGVITFGDGKNALHHLSELDSSWTLKDGYLPDYDPSQRLILPLGLPDNEDARTWDDFEEAEPILADLMRSRSARSPLLFLGTESSNRWVTQLALRLRPFDLFRPCGWCLTSQQTEREWELVGIEAVRTSLSRFLDTVRAAVRSPGSPHPASRSAGRFTGKPFKGLDYYSINDSEVFCGREILTTTLLDLVSAYTIVVVTGQSGSGKSSLLEAGLGCRITERPPLAATYTRLHDQPVESLIAGFSRLYSVKCHSIDDVIDAGMHSDVLPVVIVDQAEELFTRFDEAIRTEYAEILRAMILNPRCRARIVFGIRDDFVGNLSSLRTCVPSLLQQTLYVPVFTRAQAREIIRQPFEKCGFRVTDGLESQIVEDLSSERIYPPQLSLVCDQLFTFSKSKTVDRALYNSLGGVQGILSRVLQQAIKTLRADGETARLVLKSMVTSFGTKDVLSLSSIASRAKVAAATCASILDHFSDSARLIRRVMSADGVTYELVHEYLTEEIWSWMTADEKEQRRLQELLDKSVRAWRRIPTLRIGVDPLRQFHSGISALPMSLDHAALLILSAARHGEPKAAWILKVKEFGETACDQVGDLLFAEATNGSLVQKCDVAETLGELSCTAIMRAIGSSNQAECLLGIELAGAMRMTESIDELEQLLNRSSVSTVRQSVCGALGEIGNAKAISILINRANRGSVEEQSEAIAELGKCSDELAIAAIHKAFVSNEPMLIAAAANGLARGKNVIVARKVLTKQLDRERSHTILQAADRVRGLPENWLSHLMSVLPKVSLKDEPLSNPVLLDALETELSRRLGKKGKKSERSIAAVRLSTQCEIAEVRTAVTQANLDQVSAELAKKGKLVLPLLREMLSSEDVTLTQCGLMALADFPDHNPSAKVDWRIHIAPTLLQRVLQSGSPDDRYWGSICIAKMGYKTCAWQLRPLCLDSRHTHWHYTDIGIRVSDAAHWALDQLIPESKRWRLDWQQTFQTDAE